jgi:ABC-type multidrug transport system fused ATPase/permease subunit
MKTMLNKYIYHSLFDKIFSLLITINLIAWGNEVNESISMGGFSSNGFIFSSISLIFTLFQFQPSSVLIIVLIMILIITSLLIFAGVVIKFKKSDSSYKATLKNRYNFEETYSKLNDIQFTLDTEKRFVGAFGTLLAKMDLSDNFFTGKTIDQVFGLEESGKQIEEYTKALNGEVGRYDWMLTWNGKDYYFLISLSPLYDNLKNSVIGVIGTGQDITKLKLSEINERRLERAYNLISECNHIIYTKKRRIIISKYC